MKPIALLLLCLVTATSFAGGSHYQAKVVSIKGEYPKINLTLQFAQPPKFSSDCNKIEVIMNYSYIPWYSRFIEVKTNHPSPQQTKQAIEYLASAHSNNSSVNFGFMGYGLKETEQACHYKSKGLKLRLDSNSNAVYSFYLPT